MSNLLIHTYIIERSDLDWYAVYIEWDVFHIVIDKVCVQEN